MSARFALPIKALLIVSAFALSACRNPDRFGNGDLGATSSGLGTNGVTTSSLGDPANPTSAAYFNQSVGDRVLFVVDQSTLTDEARLILNGQAQWLQANATYAIIVEGHADEQGTREYNIALGARRADAVKTYLIAQGIAGARVQTVSYGKERPIAICSEEACYAQNRRAVTILSMQ
jgi:peptidoglycan-associated lipoprotein